MKKYKKILILVIAFLLSFALSSCNKTKTKENISSRSKTDSNGTLELDTSSYTYVNEIVEGTIHSKNVNDTTKEFVKNYSTEYKIVVVDDEEEYYQFAIDELKYFFEVSTSIELEVISDIEGIEEDGKYIFLGSTINATNLGYLSNIKEYKNSSAYLIKTNGDAIYLVGASRYGNLYSVYEFLNVYFNYKCYAIDEIEIDKNVKDINFKTIDIVEVPDFEFRQTTHGEENYNSVFYKRMRMQTEDDLIIPLKGYTFHNWLKVIPVDTYYSSHPEWFNSKKTNLNLTSDTLLNTVFENIKEDILACPDGVMVGFTQEDNAGWGDDVISNQNYEKYGVHSVESVRFLKKLASKINEWLRTYYPERDIYVFDFAYSNNMEAPAVKNSDGTYSLMEPDLTVPENAAILYCTFKSNDYYPFTDPINIDTYDNLNKWMLVTDNLMSWNYYTNFKNFFLPVDIYNSLYQNNKLLCKSGCIYLYNQFGHTQPMGSDWYRLKEYISSELSWNVNLSLNDLYEEFFTSYYKEVSDIMLEFFYQERTWFKILADIDSNLVMIRQDNNFSQEYWPKKLLENWLKMFDEAYAKIDYLKDTDSTLYNTLKDRIAAESISIRYLYVQLYKNDMTTSEYNYQHSTLVNDCLKVGFTRFSESDWTIAGI